MRHRITLMFCLVAALLLPNLNAITQEDKHNVVASYSILADVVQNIAGDRVEVTTLIPVGADPHSFLPSPRELTALAEADLIFVNGAGIEEALLDVIEGAAEDTPIVEISACVEIIPIGASGHMHEDDEHADEHDDDHAHDHDEDDHADEHDTEHDDDHADDHADDHDDEHAHEDDDDHADEHDDDHADEHDDDHAHEDEDHADEHDDDHAHEDDDDHDDHGHEDDDNHQHGETDSHCDEHGAEFVQIIGDEDAHEHGPVLGRLEAIDCGGHDHHADEHEHAHEEGACDPHVWMDPHNVIYWALMARDVLSELDPAHADDYAAAAANYIEQLEALEHDFIEPLLERLPVEKRVLITSHDSLGYLAHAYDFVIVSTVIPGGGTQIEPSARDVAALIDLLKDADVAAIFGETTVNTSVVETIAAETGASLAIIYSGTLTEGEPAGTYLDYMRYNLRTIVEALGG